jgi:hypothetical protein
MAGLPALQDSKSGQVRKEAATAISASAGVRLASTMILFYDAGTIINSSDQI